MIIELWTFKIDLLDEYKAKSVPQNRRNSKRTENDDDVDEDDAESNKAERKASYSSSSSASNATAANKKGGAKPSEYSSDQADAVKK